MIMTDDELDEIAGRCVLFTQMGDPSVLRPEDIRALLAEVHEERADRARLVAAVHHGLDLIDRLEDDAAKAVAAASDGQATP